MNEFKTLATGLNKRAKSIIQLKPRNPTTSIKGKLPVQAVCDFKQQEVSDLRFVQSGQTCRGTSARPLPCVCVIHQSWIVLQITVHKGDECALLNNSQPYKWKVLNHAGNEAVVPSVCFMVPPVNKEAVDSVSR